MGFFKKLIQSSPALKLQKKLADSAAQKAPRYQAPKIDAEVTRLADEQATRAKDYRANMDVMREEQFQQAAGNSRKSLAQSMAGNKTHYNSRGLLFSGMKSGGEIDAQTDAANQLATQKADINIGLDQGALDRDEKALGTRMQLAQMQNDNANVQQQMDAAADMKDGSLSSKVKGFGAKLLKPFG